jgi:hypothetical protein
MTTRSAPAAKSLCNTTLITFLAQAGSDALVVGGSPSFPAPPIVRKHSFARLRKSSGRLS